MTHTAEIELPMDRLRGHRVHKYHSSPKNGVASLEGALDFVDQRGFVYFWPIEGVELPSLWVAVAGARPVPNEHDDPGHITWQWKDEMLGRRQWYYAKVLRKRATFISMKMAPYFYALSENYGSPAEDYLIQYEQGRMKQETKSVYEAILAAGPIDTVELRRKVGLTSRASDYRFSRALAELQADFKVMPVAVAEAGAWRYAFVYDLVPRHLPDLPEQARLISESEARREILRRYFDSVGASTLRQVIKLCQWDRRSTETGIYSLVEDGSLRENVALPGSDESWFALRSLVDPGHN